MRRSIGILSCLVVVSCGHQSPPVPTPDATPPAVQYEAHVVAGTVMPPGVQLTNPHNGDPDVAKKGALLFAAMNCDGCHGGDASGWVGPSLSDQRWRYGGADSEVFSSIFYGRPKGMPAFGGAVGADGVWSIVTFLRSLPLPSDVSTESWPDP
jgi:cytochrome c oxidase cbb3-type subunit III